MSNDPVLDELAARPELFCRQLDRPMRAWFTRRILTYLRTGPPPHNDHDDAMAALALAKTLAAECDAALAAEPDTDLRRFLLRDLAVRSAYGAIGVHPATLLREDRTDYLLFTIKRRCFAVDRMRVNVNSGDEFEYPARGLLTSHPNLQSLHYWIGVTDNPAGGTKRYPFVLSPTAGVGDPLGAIERMFESNVSEDDRNAFDCAAAAMVVHMAALIEAAANPSALAKALAAGGERYFAIDHPYGSAALISGELLQGASAVLTEDAAAGDHVELTVAFAWTTPPPGDSAMLVAPDHEELVQIEAVGHVGSQYTGKITIGHLSTAAPAGTRLVPQGMPEFHLITDRGADSLFEQVFIPDDELQIGDHVYVASHPLHRALLSGISAWGGEHAFACSAPVARRDAMLISGHGIVEQTLRQAMDGHLLVDLNAFLDILREVVRHQLTARPVPTWTGSSDLLTNAQEFWAGLRRKYGEPDDSAVIGTCRVYDYAGVTYIRDDDPRVQTSGRYQTMTFEGSVGHSAVDANAFIVYRADPDAAATDWSSVYFVLERSDTVNTGRTDLERFGVHYRDDTQEQVRVFLPLFHTDAELRSGARRLHYDDVAQALYGGPGNTSFVTRPRVVADGTDTYLAALRQKGALAAP